jgi:hypothetical protein
MALIAAIVPLSSAAADTPPAAVPVAAASYAFTTIDFPGAAKTSVWGINTAGDIVGNYVDTNAQTHGFLLSRGTFTTLDYPSSDVIATQGIAINAAGDIAGVYSLKSPAPATNAHAYLRTKDGKWSTVDYADATHIMQGGVYGLLADGTMVGCFHEGNPATAMHGYALGPKGATRFDYPANAPFAMHYGASPDGSSIVGAYLLGTNTPDNWHGYLLNGGKVTSVDVPGKLGTQAFGMGPAGEIVGAYKVLGADGKTWLGRGFLADTRGSLDPAQWAFTMVDVPAASQTFVRGINDSGNLVGYYFDASGVAHGFVASAAAVTTPPAAAPAPPNTGNVGFANGGDGTSQAVVWLVAIAGLGALALGVRRVAVVRKSR